MTLTDEQQRDLVATQRAVDLINEFDLVAQFQHKIRTRQLGLAEARDNLFAGVMEYLREEHPPAASGDQVADEAFAWRVVDDVERMSGCASWRYDW